VSSVDSAGNDTIYRHTVSTYLLTYLLTYYLLTYSQLYTAIYLVTRQCVVRAKHFFLRTNFKKVFKKNMKAIFTGPD